MSGSSRRIGRHSCELEDTEGAADKTSYRRYPDTFPIFSEICLLYIEWSRGQDTGFPHISPYIFDLLIHGPLLIYGKNGLILLNSLSRGPFMISGRTAVSPTTEPPAGFPLLDAIGSTRGRKRGPKPAPS